MRTVKRRRKETKTDYKLRMGLLKSGDPRIVVRRTNKYFILQAVESNEAQDKVIAGVTSKELLKKGWSDKNVGSLKSIPAGYLTGLLLAKKIVTRKSVPPTKGDSKESRSSTGKGKFIIDLGMARTIPGSRSFAVVKGLIDGGLDISANEKAFPSEERINGEHLSDELKSMIAKVRSKI